VVKQLRDSVTEIQTNIGNRIFDQALKGENIDWENLIPEQERVLIKRRMFALRRHTLPPVITHNMVDDGSDPILSCIRRLHLFNDRMDRVKIVYHPEFLNASNPLMGLDYDDFVRGCHLGVFPSYYEPWGYTPAECTVMGVPSVTTNLSGFGCYMEDNIENPSDYGIYIVDRRLKNAEESIIQLTQQLFSFTKKTRRQRINQRNRTERLSDLLDWKRMGLEYVRARQLALRRIYPDQFNEDDDDELFEPAKKIPHPISIPGTPKKGKGTDDPLAFRMQALGLNGEENMIYSPIPLKKGESIPAPSDDE